MADESRALPHQSTREDFGNDLLGGYIEHECEGAWRWTVWHRGEVDGGHASDKVGALSALEHFFDKVKVRNG